METNEDELPKKRRRMRRRLSRRKKEYETRTGVDFSKTTNILRCRLRRRDEKIEKHEQEIRDLKAKHKKELRVQEVALNKKIRMTNTKLRQLQQKFDAFRERKGYRHRTVVWKRKFQKYDIPTNIKTFEEKIGTLSCDLGRNETNIESFERIVKTLEYIEEVHNKENPTHKLTLTHYILLLNLLFLRLDNGLGVTAPKIQIPSLSQHQIRTSLNHLVDIKMLDKRKLKFRITLMGEDFLKKVKHHITKKKESVFIETLKLNILGETGRETLNRD